MTLAAELQEAEAELELARIEAQEGADQPLSARQEQFVSQYLVDLNGTQAAIRAGYSPKTAAETACLALRSPKIKKRIERAKQQRMARVNVTQEQVLAEMALLANSRLDWFSIDDDGQVQLTDHAPEGAMGAVQSIKKRTKVQYDKDGEIVGKTYDVELRLWNKPDPLKLMGRHVGLFPNRVEIVGRGGGPIEVAEIPIEELLERHRSLAELAPAPNAIIDVTAEAVEDTHTAEAAEVVDTHTAEAVESTQPSA